MNAIGWLVFIGLFLVLVAVQVLAVPYIVQLLGVEISETVSALSNSLIATLLALFAVCRQEGLGRRRWVLAVEQEGWQLAVSLSVRNWTSCQELIVENLDLPGFREITRSEPVDGESRGILPKEVRTLRSRLEPLDVDSAASVSAINRRILVITVGYRFSGSPAFRRKKLRCLNPLAGQG